MSTTHPNERPNVFNAALGGDADAMSAALARNWWAIALRGLAGVVFGLIALFLPGITMLALVLLFSAYMLVDGVFAIISAIRAARRRERWGLLLVEGVLSILTGAVAFLWPGITLIAFVLLVAAWAIVTGCLMFIAGFRLNLNHGRWWLVLGGIVSVIFGALLVIAPPLGALVLTWWLGGYALVFGALLIVLGFRLRSRHTDQGRPTIAQSAA
jgi:uncharacterized membrane protein HdeD (DUF308 family)